MHPHRHSTALNALKLSCLKTKKFNYKKPAQVQLKRTWAGFFFARVLYGES